MNRNWSHERRNPEAGFTLVEVLIAIVILVFGLVAVTNLFLIAGSSNMAANAGSAATALASQQMEELKAMPFLDARLAAGGSLVVDPAAPVAGYSRYGIQVPGAAGAVDMTWQIIQVQAQLKHIQVVAQARGPMLGARTQARFTTFRSCTDPVRVNYDAAVCAPGDPVGVPCCAAGQAPCCPVAP